MTSIYPPSNSFCLYWAASRHDVQLVWSVIISRPSFPPNSFSQFFGDPCPQRFLLVLECKWQDTSKFSRWPCSSCHPSVRSAQEQEVLEAIRSKWRLVPLLPALRVEAGQCLMGMIGGLVGNREQTAQDGYLTLAGISVSSNPIRLLGPAIPGSMLAVAIAGRVRENSFFDSVAW